MDEANAEEVEQVDEGCNEGEEHNHLGECNDMERGQVSNLLVPPVGEEVRHWERDDMDKGQVSDLLMPPMEEEVRHQKTTPKRNMWWSLHELEMIFGEER